MVSVVAAEREWKLADVAKEAKAELVCGSSLKATLDCDWDQSGQKVQALSQVLSVLEAVEQWFQSLAQEDQHLQAKQYLDVAHQIKIQDIEKSEDGKETLIEGVAKDRRISIEDEQMRHGRKSRSVRVDGYKRHVLHDLDSGLVRAVGLTAANAPEASVTEAISEDLMPQEIDLQELHIDRAYLSSEWVRHRREGLEIYCKAWPVRQGKLFSKQEFHLDWERQIIRCPAEQEMPFTPGGVVHFSQEHCNVCPLRTQCTKSPKGRSVSIHPDEALLAELRQRQLTPAGRAKLRERVAVEHTLAHIGHWQGRRARYRGIRKNLFDLRRCAVIHNLHVLAHSDAFLQAA
jgi:transposase